MGLFKCFKIQTASYSVIANSCLEKLNVKSHKFSLSKPKLNEKYLLDEESYAKIQENIKLRKGIGNIDLVHDINQKIKNVTCVNAKNTLEKQLLAELKKIPNETHPEVKDLTEPKVVKYFNEKREFKHNPLEFSEICKALRLLRTDHLGNFSGHKNYYLTNDLAAMEHALVRYTLAELFSHGFSLISVPDILPAKVIESCGMQVAEGGERNLIYRLLPSDLCLSGTSEMALAGYFAGSTLKASQKPLKVAAVSRCFRAETSGLQEERGIYRVHQFTKVEMFSVCHCSQSESILNEFRDIEINLFNRLGIHFQLLDMPPCELGAPAFRKYDIEAWMPGRKLFGEISSCSNCTDYQSRRLNITIDDAGNFAHTVNGTACAIPRMLIALIETFQNEDGTITIPKELQKYMKREKILRQKVLPELKLAKHISKSQT